MIYQSLLVDSAKQIGINLSPEQVEKFATYLDLLKSWNSKINLTAISDDKQIIIKHFVDSLTICSLIKPFSKVLDIGTGAGFPGIPLKIYEDSLEVFLMDSVAKKTSFLKEVRRKLNIKNLDVINTRAENVKDDLRNCFDYIVFRAFSDFEFIISLSKPYLKEDGKLVIMKGDKGIEEYDSYKQTSPNVIKLEELKELKLPVLEENRKILVVKYL
mgnify:CR=1 FL=1